MARDDLAQLRALAGEKGFIIEQALMKDRYRLIEERTDVLIRNAQGSVAFTIEAAIKFLRRWPDPR